MTEAAGKDHATSDCCTAAHSAADAGYSSLSYRSRLPVHELKVDQSFVRRLHQSHSDAALVNAIIMMGQELGLSLIAEGVETGYQKEYLIKRGCSTMQGYLFSHPLAGDEFEQFSRRFIR